MPDDGGVTRLPRARAAAVLAAAALVLTACSGGDKKPAALDASPSAEASASPSASPSPSPSPRTTPTPTPTSKPAGAASVCAGFPVLGTMTIAGRTVRVASPSGPTSRVPVVIGLAGYDQSAATFDSQSGLTGRLGNRALVIVAEGLGSPLAWQFRQGQTRDVDWLRAVIQQATASCGRSDAVAIAGLSDGGVMAVRAACSIGVASLVTSSASARPPEGCRLPLTLLAQHGTDDSFDPYGGDGKEIPPAREAIAAWAAAAKCKDSTDTSPSGGVHRLVYQSCVSMSGVELVTLDGAKHGWPQSYDLTSRLIAQLELATGSGFLIVAGTGASGSGAGGSGANKAPFTSSISTLTAAMLPKTWHQGCPVSPDKLRRLSVTFLGFDGKSHQGLIDVAADSATQLVGVFKKIYDANYPIRQMRPVDEFDGSDDKSTTADNTAAFNCRQAVGGSGWSQHSYGHAIDIDPVENPYISGGQVLPANGAPYTDRSQHKPGMVHAGDAVYNAFYSIGWKWGGYFSGSPDYQHFSATGT